MHRPAIADYPPGARLPTRVIDDFEFVWLLRGRARFIADEELLLTPGRLLLVPPGLRHTFEWDPARPTRHGYVHFGLADVTADPEPRVRLLHMTDQDPLPGLCSHLLWLGGVTRDGWEDQARRTLDFMLGLIDSEYLPGLGSTPRPAPVLRAAIAHLRRHWSQPPLRRIGVSELATMTSVSRGHLNRLFQNGFGISAATALERLRLSRAEPLLTRTDLAIKTIAWQCGFADPSHLSHRFTTIYGMSPSLYRTTGGSTPSVLEHPGLRRLSHLVWE